MAELKPCPFCGAMPRIVKFHNRFYDRLSIHQVMCFSCCTKPKFFGRGITEQRAIEAWNRRAGDGDGNAND